MMRKLAGSEARGQAEAALDRLYREVIMDHYRAPRNRRAIAHENASAEGRNALCGDAVRIGLRVAGGRIEEAGFLGEGCALSMAAASMLAERCEGLEVGQARELIEEFGRFLRGEPEDSGRSQALDDLTAFEGVSKFPVRIKCVLLPFQALRQALAGIDLGRDAPKGVEKP